MTASPVPAAPTSAAAIVPGKHLTFALGAEEFAVPVLRVREIIRMLAVTPVPHSATHVRGVVNLRGKVVPVIDLRVRLGYPERPYEERTCIIVAEARVRGNAVMVGLIVDAVTEVVLLSADDISPPPPLEAIEQMGCVLGLARTRGRVSLLLEVDRIMEAAA